MVVAIEMVDQHYQDGKRCDGADGHIQDDQGPYLPIGGKTLKSRMAKPPITAMALRTMALPV